jgi:tRNA threonylcarbamoyladenosine dehydratase
MNADFERRFGGLRRLYGMDGAQAVFDAHVVVVGIGGVGSWAAEALARSGVGRLTLIDMDHIAESNVNRQIHALTPTLGQSKVAAMRERIALIHPGCRIDAVDDFVTPDNWARLGEGLLNGRETLAVIDACDQVRAKTVMTAWALSSQVPFVTVGAAGGKRLAQAVEVDDLAAVTHDPLLAKLRYTLRKQHGAAREARIGVCCVFSRESVALPDASCVLQLPDGSLNCHGYGSAVSVTASFGLCAAGWVINTLAENARLKERQLSKSNEMTL